MLPVEKSCSVSSLHVRPAGDSKRAARNKSCLVSVSEDAWREEEEETEGEREGKELQQRRKIKKNNKSMSPVKAGMAAIGKGNRKVFL